MSDQPNCITVFHSRRGPLGSAKVNVAPAAGDGPSADARTSRLKWIRPGAAICVAIATSTVSAGVTTLASFDGPDGFSPNGGLVLSDGILYGTTYKGSPTEGATPGYGTVFSVPITGGTPTVLASFDVSDGSYPSAGLLLNKGVLYGTASYGGAENDGVVFSVPVTGGAPTVLASFNGADGIDPLASLILSDGSLYGTTFRGGPHGGGTIFSVPVTGGTPTILGSLSGDGANGTPAASDAALVVSGSTLYGTTTFGGTAGLGTVFSLPTTGGAPTVLASFDLTNGSAPSGLVLSGGTLYGTAYIGGPSGYASSGTVFSVPVTGGTAKVLASFDGSDGAYPVGPLTILDGTLYGSTHEGGAHNLGAVFSVPTIGGTPTVLASFGVYGSSGDFPLAGLTPSGHTLYGATSSGGSSNSGTVFEISTPEPASWAMLAVTAASALLLCRRAKINLGT